MQVREPPLGDGDVQQLGPGEAMNHALLAVQAGLGPDCHIIGKPRQTYLEETRLPGWEMMGNVRQVKKDVFLQFFQHYWLKNTRGDVKSNGEG
jgi:hypothetical protein